MKPNTRRRRHSSKKRRITRRRLGGNHNLLSISFNQNTNSTCELPGMSRDAIQELPDSELSQLLNKYGPTFHCILSDRKGCPSYRRQEQLNQKGVYSSVFKSCCSDSCHYVTKIVYFTMYNNNNYNNNYNNNNNNNYNTLNHVPEGVDPVEKEAFMNELWMQAKAASIGVAPPIRKVLLSDSRGIMIMDSMKEDLEDHIQRYIADPKTTSDNAYDEGIELANKIGEQIMKLHRHNIIHGDIHQNNVMFDHRGACKLIDYGMAIPIPMEYLAEDYLRNNDISSQIIDAYRGDYKMSLDKTRLRQLSERRLFNKNVTMNTKVKFRSLFEGLSEGLDEWLEKDMDYLYMRVKKYIKEQNVV